MQSAASLMRSLGAVAAGGPLFKLVCRFEWAQSDIRTWARCARGDMCAGASRAFRLRRPQLEHS
jgi:hypothetical protein